MKTAFVSHPDYLLHNTGIFHPERSARIKTILSRITDDKMDTGSPLHHLIQIEPDPADISWIKSVHDSSYVDAVPVWCKQNLHDLPTGDTTICPASYHVALLASGGGLSAVDAIMDGRVDNAFSWARPPGHHAESSRGMGFCIFNNIAIAARYAQQRYQAERIVIIDWDVHHGNGTQQIFEEDPSVFYISIHQSPHYPFTGMASERGEGEGEGYTLNIPVSSGAGNEIYIDAFNSIVVPAVAKYKPDFIFLSAGFDAHRDDPLSETVVTELAFNRMMEHIMELADNLCESRLVSILEGGYDLEALAHCVSQHLIMLTSGHRPGD